MLLSVQTAGIVDKVGIDEGYRMIGEAGFDGVDVNLDHLYQPRRKHTEGSIFDQSDEEILDFVKPQKDAAAKYGIRFVQAHAPFPSYVEDAEENAYTRMTLKKTIMICDYLDCRNLVVHPGFRGAGNRMSAEEEWDYNWAMYTDLIPELKKYHVTCCLENMFVGWRGKIMQAICMDPAEANRYIDALNEYAGEKLFGFCWDIGHSNLAGQDLYKTILTLGDRIQCLHVHDNNGFDDEHLFPYMGIVNWKDVCRGLKEIHYANDFSFETFNAIETFDIALAPDLLRLLHSTGELLRGRIIGE